MKSDQHKLLSGELLEAETELSLADLCAAYPIYSGP